jgi:hypothetical protein
MNITILILGLPRSGTTFIAEVLGWTTNTQLILEPDNEKTSFLARKFKNKISRFPTDHESENDLSYQKLWTLASSSSLSPILSRGLLTKILLGKDVEISIAKKEQQPHKSNSKGTLVSFIFNLFPSNKTLVLKSVHAVLNAEWLVSYLKPDKIIIPTRHPLAILASWRRMKMPDSLRRADEAVCWAQKHFNFSAQFDFTHPDIQRSCQFLWFEWSLSKLFGKENVIQVVHEEICVNIVSGFKKVYQHCGFDWTSSVEKKVLELNKPGQGYSTKRLASAEANKWKKDFDEKETELLLNFFREAGYNV